MSLLTGDPQRGDLNSGALTLSTGTDENLNIMEPSTINASPGTPGQRIGLQDLDRLHARDMEDMSISEDELNLLSKRSINQGALKGSESLHTSHELPVKSSHQGKTSSQTPSSDNDISRISAYARLDFENFTFFVQTLQVVLGRKSNDDLLQSSHHSVDVHLSGKKAILRRHAKIFYNFGTQRFEISIMGRNGAFIDEMFLEKGITVPLVDGTKIQIGDITFTFVLPLIEPVNNQLIEKPFNPSDAVNLKLNFSGGANTVTPIKPPQNLYDPKKIKTEKSSELVHDVEESRKFIQRRMSVSRRESIATATIEEINEVMNQLGPAIEGDDEFENSEFLDAQVEAILNDHRKQMATNVDLENDPDIIKFTEFSGTEVKDEEEDEIDQLVKQHNMSQGVNLDNLDDNDNRLNVPGTGDGELALLDQEIATFDALEGSKSLTSGQFPRNGLYKTTPLMGKPAKGVVLGPRMGRPASIQPNSRIYTGTKAGADVIGGRIVYGNTGYGNINSTVTNNNNYMGLPTHLVASSSGFPLKVAHGTLGGTTMPPRPPPVLLEAPLGQVDTNRARKVSNAGKLDPVKVLDPCNPPRYPKLNVPVRYPRKKRGISSGAAKRAPKKVYALDEIPEQYRIKPSLSFPLLISNVLKGKTGGLTLTEIGDGIKDTYPYYKYCLEGWLATVSHNLVLSRIFTNVGSKVDAEGIDEWIWIIDDSFIKEREKVRLKLQELAAAKAKEASLKAEEWKQRQRFDQAGSGRYSPLTGLSGIGQTFGLVSNGVGNVATSRLPFVTQLQQNKPKTIAEIASEIRRDSNGKQYFNNEVANVPTRPLSGGTPSSIKDQLAANRSQQANFGTPPPTVNIDTKKSLAYLQKELFTLYKARKLSFNTATTTEIITKALATTIAQVNAIGSKAGCGDNALGFLVERAPQQVSKILDIALSKSIKERQGGSLSGTPTRSNTPVPVSTSPHKEMSTPSLHKEMHDISKSSPGAAGANPDTAATVGTAGSPIPIIAPTAVKAIGKPPLFKLGTVSEKGDRLGRPPAFKSGGAHVSNLGKPPLFLSNRGPSRPAFLKPEPTKREGEEGEEASKRVKLE